ncbi:MAG: pseudouridine synthase [Traorella sp.]
MRLDKYLAHVGLGSRKEVKEYIRKQRIRVNGKIVKKDDYKVDENNDIVSFDQQVLTYKKYVYYMLNKPQGVISATYDLHDKTVLDCFDCFLPDDVFPVGRLDKDSEGLLLISNDGDLAHKLLSLKYHVDKTYYVKCQEDLNDEMILQLQRPIQLKEDSFQPANVEKISDNELYITIQEGKFHQVKRMIHYVGNEVIYLKRISFGPLILDAKLNPGEYRELNEEEIKQLGEYR